MTQVSVFMTGGILLHSPDLSRHTRPLNRYLRHEARLGGRGSASIEAQCQRSSC